MFLEVDKIDFGYDAKERILNQITFGLSKGATLSIVGASGCGKSTLLRLISGILPNSTHNYLQGRISINSLTTNEYRQTGKLAFMFQEATLMPQLTVKQNIELPLKMKGSMDPRKVSDLIHAVGLNDYSDYFPNRLSGGMKTRVALARSFATSPELLLLDEPFSALDIVWKSKLYFELEKLRERYNTTVLLVTHDVQESLLLSDQIIVLSSLGSIELRKENDSGYPIIERIKNISGYMNKVYKSSMLPIQDAIIKGQAKKHEKQNFIPVV